MEKSRYNIIELRQELANRSAELSQELLGAPNCELSSRQQLRFGRKGSLAVVIAGPKIGSWYDYENAVGGDLLALIRREHRGDFRAAAEYAQQFIGSAGKSRATGHPSTQRYETTTERVLCGNQQRALELWDQALPIAGTAADRHFTKRGIVAPAIGSEVVRFHPACPYGEGAKQQCMLALLRDICTNEPRAIHRTALTSAGEKIGRMVLGPKAGAAIKLSPDGAVTMGLAIAEGIETALSGMQLGWQPAWSVVDAGGITKFPVLSGIEVLTILVDNDKSGTGQRAAIACSDRWTRAGRQVLRVLPHHTGDDLNDIVRKRAVA